MSIKGAHDSTSPVLSYL